MSCTHCQQDVCDGCGPVHVLPVNDLIEHEETGDECPCGVTVEAVFREDGSNGWLIIHHSLDGREASEAS